VSGTFLFVYKNGGFLVRGKLDMFSHFNFHALEGILGLAFSEIAPFNKRCPIWCTTSNSSKVTLFF